MAKKIKKTNDPAHDETDLLLMELERRISEEYAVAEEEIEATLEEYLEKYAVKDEIKQEALLKGKISQTDYNKWKEQQLLAGERWRALRDTIAYELTVTNQIAKEIAYDLMPTIYAMNFNYGTFQVEKASGINTIFTLYNKDAVALLFNDNDKLYHEAGIKLSRKIAMNKDLEWNKQNIQSIMLQGILQGESIPHLATRLQKGASEPFDATDIKNANKKTAKQIAQEVSEKNRKAAIRNARTMTTYVENKGRENAYKRSEELGLEVMKEWRATYDNRTRHEHRLLNLQKKPIDEPFEVDGYEINEPGDPDAPGFLIYNCRCRMAVEYKGFERKKSYKTYYDPELMGMSYEEWLKAKPKSQRITHLEEVGEAMKRKYIADYRRLKQ